MQLDPDQPTLKAPGTECLKLNYDNMLSNFGFNFNLRRYNSAAVLVRAADGIATPLTVGLFQTGAYNRPLFGST